MDRNLGAESTATSDVVSKGLYFQWGRKDPFIYPKENRKSDNKTPATTWNLQGYEFEVHSHYTGNYPLSDYSIAWSLEHPTSFIGSAPNLPAAIRFISLPGWLITAPICGVILPEKDHLRSLSSGVESSCVQCMGQDRVQEGVGYYLLGMVYVL